MDRAHDYRLALRWEEDGPGTVDYKRYSRQYRVTIEGKPDLVGSADPHFRGDPRLYNPEELLVVALSSCHMLSYLALCARRRVRVLAYTDEAHGRMVEHGDGGRFAQVTLRPRVTLAAGADLELARALHHDAHETCYIASSVNFPVTCEPDLEVEPLRRDLAIRVRDTAALAQIGETLGRAGVSVEGGGAWGAGGERVAHFLVEDAARGRAALAEAGLEVIAVRDVITTRLDQERPGQLGAFTRALADAGVDVQCVYSDHDHRLVVVVDDEPRAREVAEAWLRRG